MVNEMQQHFEKEKYVVIRNFLSPETCKILYRYCNTRAQSIKYKKEKTPEFYNKKWDGGYGDKTLDEAFASYGDPMGDSLLELALGDIQQITGKVLLPNYSYWRLYFNGGELRKHKDRPSCEISATLCLGYDISNLVGDYNWSINFENLNQEIVSINLYPGDMIVYMGCDLEHWREKFLGINQAQLFFHYSDANGPFKNVFDGRDLLGVAAGLN
jgi:hypothetical protein